MNMDFYAKICLIHFLYIFLNVVFTLEAKEKSGHHHHRRHHHHYHRNRYHHHRHNETRHQAFAKGGNIARQKCDEYTSQACNIHSYGRGLFNRGSYSTGTIAGGRLALPKEFPHMGALGTGGASPRWFCGCSLISESFVVTAAHCAALDPKYVRFGDLSLGDYLFLGDKEDDATAIQKEVIQYFIHPNYNSQVFNDIALVRIQSLPKFTDYVRPICLHTLDNIPKGKLGVIGWGRIVENGPISPKLRHTELDEQDPKLCKNLYNYDDRTMICAGYLPGGKDSCPGDSGGPLQIMITPRGCSEAIYSIVGIVSKGHGCGRKDTPAVYTRISYFIPWIESIVWK